MYQPCYFNTTGSEMPLQNAREYVEIKRQRGVCEYLSAIVSGATHLASDQSETECKLASPKLAVAEAVEASVEDHFSFFWSKLSEASRPHTAGTPRVSHHTWCELCERNLRPQIRPCVVRQHDHPIAGIHYDLWL